MWAVLMLNLLVGYIYIYQSFKTWTDLVGRPGTRPTWAWDRSGWRQKPAWELARQNPVDPAGRPGTRSNPGDIYIYI